MPSLIEPGVVVDGKYRVVRRIGEGGMGTVYEGENIRIERRVAIKVLHEHVASSAEFAERFEREARASARVGSEHVCDVLDLGDLPNGERYLVMEFLDGESLEDRLERVGRMSAEELAPIAFQLLDGLGTMHQAGVIHRDLKPANIFLARVPRKATEVVKILDFGVAKIAERADQPSAMTSTGMMMGTPLYMSPEQARGARDVDGRTDIYAASVIFYRALTGEMPHLGNNLHELLFKIVLEDPRAIRDIVPEVDEAFAAIVTKGLARDADERFSSARAFQEQIKAWGTEKGDPRLLFTITLSDRPPALRTLSGGYPAERLAAQIGAMATPTGQRVGPPTPRDAATQAASPMATPTPRRSGGTPMVWSDATPELLRNPLAMQAKTLDSRHSAPGGTQLIGAGAYSQANPGTAAPASTTVSSPPRNGLRAAAGIAGGFVLLGVVGGGLWLASANKTGTPASGVGVVSSTSVTNEPAPPSSVTATHDGDRTSTALAEPNASAEPAPSIEPSAVAIGAAPRPAPKVASSAPASKASPPKVTTVASVSAAPPSSASAPPPSPTTGHRKYRTDL